MGQKLTIRQEQDVEQAKCNTYIVAGAAQHDPVFSAYFNWLVAHNLPLVRVHTRGKYGFVRVDLVTTRYCLNEAGFKAAYTFLQNVEVAHERAAIPCARNWDTCASRWIPKERVAEVATTLFALATNPDYLRYR